MWSTSYLLRLPLGISTRTSNSTASEPEDKAEFFDPAADKICRHPSFYAIPDEVEELERLLWEGEAGADVRAYLRQLPPDPAG